MKKLTVFFIGVLFSAGGFTAIANNQTSNPVITHTFPASSIQSVEVSTPGGSITVDGNADSEAVVEVYVQRNRGSKEPIDKLLKENYTIDIQVHGGKLYAVVKRKKAITVLKTQGIRISFKISVPKQVDSQLHTNGGSIRMSDLLGSQNFQTGGGALSVENVSGTVVGETSGGSITVTNSKGKIDLKTTGGSITAKNCDGEIEIATWGGSLLMIDLNGNINASTNGGSITANNIHGVIKTGTIGGSIRLNNISGSLDAKTSGGTMNVTMQSVSEYVNLSNIGNINLTVPANQGYYLKAKANKITTSGMKGFSGNMNHASIDGMVDNGGARIEIKTALQINLSFK